MNLIAALAHIFNEAEILQLQGFVEQIHLSDRLMDYILDLGCRNT